ncbi:hypothetical protein BD311DRAFT_648127 [Dichomitus squalens]|uniref:DUF6533 domain-containing protein n=1 Tax=Dichomitus squalens TaxID=114155 RepID=A0A4Q9N4R1_9APHY|nr:hypothetical protein BD311DRAFT_648127 [Dichomitus squalens]
MFIRSPQSCVIALLVYDTCLTYDQELRLIWSQKTSAAMWIYVSNRYLAIYQYTVNLFMAIGANKETCSLIPAANLVFSALRGYALSGRGWHITSVIMALSLVPVVTYVVSWCLILSDILVLCITWTKTYGIVRLAKQSGLDLSSSLTTVMLRDGTSRNVTLRICTQLTITTSVTMCTGSLYFM